MKRYSIVLLCAIASSGCSTFEAALDYGRGPYDRSPAATNQAALEGLHESSWGNSGRWGAKRKPGTVLFVTNKRGNDLSVIDLVSGEEIRRVPTCTNPHELAVSPDGAHLAVGCYGGTSVDILSTVSLEKVTSIDLGPDARPHGIVWHESGSIFATAEGRQEIVRISGPISNTPLIDRYTTGKRGSHMLALAPDLRWAWTTDLGSRTVTRIDLQGSCDASSACDNEDRLPPLSVAVGEEPEGIALSPDGRALWVSARGSNEAFKLDPETLEVRETVSTGRFPLRLAIRPQGDVAITSDLADGSLSVIDLASARILRTIPVSGPREAQGRFQVTILWSADGRQVYVAETGSNTVAEIDYVSGVVLRRLAVGDGGDGLAIHGTSAVEP